MSYFDHEQANRQAPSTCFVAICSGIVVIVGILFSVESASGGDILIFAAASQRDPLEAVIASYSGQNRKNIVKASYQSSSTLARQIELGAPADIYISANSKWMDYLEDRKLIDASTRRNMFGNSLVLVTAKTGISEKADIKSGFDLTSLLGDGRLAVGDPDHVPAGIYAKQAMQNLGIWDSIKSKLARADNVRAALALVSRGEAPYGITYSSDAVADRRVEVVGAFPEDSHLKIVYPVAITENSQNTAGAKAFFQFLKAPEAIKIYKKFGFRVLGVEANQ